MNAAVLDLCKKTCF